ncbi:MAG: hypothetical protein MJY89_02600 [Bacteroidales bacterium]|nr:hypothetical protein [Bacteroidales bacterium]
MKTYVNLRIDEVKLKAIKGISSTFGKLFSFLLILAVFIILLGLLSVALVQWLNGIFKAPIGTLIVAGAFLVLFAVLVLCRKKLFRNTFIKPLAETFFDDEH